MELSCFFDDPKDVFNVISNSSAVSKSILEFHGSCIVGRRFRDIVQQAVIKIIPKKKKRKKAKRFEEALQIGEKRKEGKGKGKIFPFECRVPKNSKER